MKLNWSAPKDATYAVSNLEVTNLDEVYTLLKSSEFTMSDIKII